MQKALRLLDETNVRLAGATEADMPLEAINRLCVTAVAGSLHVEYCGSPFDEPLQEVLKVIATPEVADVLASLTLRGPDKGANGTRNWDLSILADCDVVFHKLRELFIEQNKPADHNRTVVAATYKEDGVLARVLKRSPSLMTLVTPSAPDIAFFQVGQRPLGFLSVDAGYDTQAFIRNLARSSCFPNLRCLEFGEYNEKYMADYSDHCTPLADYQRLFAAKAFQPVGRFVWRNPACSEAEIIALQELRRDLQMLIVRTSSVYVP